MKFLVLAKGTIGSEHVIEDKNIMVITAADMPSALYTLGVKMPEEEHDLFSREVTIIPAPNSLDAFGEGLEEGLEEKYADILTDYLVGRLQRINICSLCGELGGIVKLCSYIAEIDNLHNYDACLYSELILQKEYERAERQLEEENRRRKAHTEPNNGIVTILHGFEDIDEQRKKNKSA